VYEAICVEITPAAPRAFTAWFQTVPIGPSARTTAPLIDLPSYCAASVPAPTSTSGARIPSGAVDIELMASGTRSCARDSTISPSAESSRSTASRISHPWLADSMVS
jgi:hypothetical protein